MRVQIFKDIAALSSRAADEILSVVRQKPAAVLCFAAGETPALTYSLLAEKARAEKTDFSKITFVGLDEWVGVPAHNEGSCHFFLQRKLFAPLHIDAGQIHLFDALAADLAEECKKMDGLIRAKGGIDLMLVGIGMNGHIGFNEPGVSPGLYSHIADLDDTTTSVGQKYFRKATALRQGITLGLAHFLESRQGWLLATGSKKASIIKRALEDPVSTAVPASFIRKHGLVTVMLDEDAAALLTSGRGS